MNIFILFYSHEPGEALLIILMHNLGYQSCRFLAFMGKRLTLSNVSMVAILAVCLTLVLQDLNNMLLG